MTPRPITFAALTLVLAGCAPTVPVMVVSPGPEAAPRPPPASEIMNESLVSPRSGTGAIVITSDVKAWPAQGCTLDVALDDQLVAGLQPGEQVVLFAEPGERTVSLSVRDEASCRPAAAQVALGVVAHTTQRIRVGPDTQHDLTVDVDTYGRSLPP
jgi:hypothetical protein